MERVQKEFELGGSRNLADACEIARLVTGSNNLAHATDLFAGFLKEHSYSLLYFGDYDSSADTSSHVIWSALSDELTQMCAHFDSKRGCPLVQMAIKSESSFEALGLYLAGFDDFFSMKYLQEMQRMGHEQIGVIPIVADDRMFVFFVGMDHTQFVGKVREQLTCAFAQFVASVSIKHLSDNSSAVYDFPAKNLTLSKRETECLTWTAQGKTSYEISIILKLSEHTINNYISNACRRLDAANKSHAVAKAIQMEMIDLSELS